MLVIDATVTPPPLHLQVSKAVRGVPRRTESETKLWEAFEKLSDLSQLQRAQIQHLAKTQGRFQHKPDSKEAKIIEEKFLSLKKKETDSLQARKRDFERLIEEHAETMNNVKTKLLETEKEAREVTHERDDEALQKKHAKEAYAEVKEWLDEAQKSIKGLQDDIQRHERINAALDDTTKDMASKIENYQADVSARDNIIKDETAKSDRARVELGEAQRVLTEEQDNGAVCRATHSVLRADTLPTRVPHHHRGSPTPSRASGPRPRRSTPACAWRSCTCRLRSRCSSSARCGGRTSTSCAPTTTVWSSSWRPRTRCFTVPSRYVYTHTHTHTRTHPFTPVATPPPSSRHTGRVAQAPRRGDP